MRIDMVWSNAKSDSNFLVPGRIICSLEFSALLGFSQVFPGVWVHLALVLFVAVYLPTEFFFQRDKSVEKPPSLVCYLSYPFIRKLPLGTGDDLPASMRDLSV